MNMVRGKCELFTISQATNLYKLQFHWKLKKSQKLFLRFWSGIGIVCFFMKCLPQSLVLSLVPTRGTGSAGASSYRHWSIRRTGRYNWEDAHTIIVLLWFDH